MLLFLAYKEHEVNKVLQSKSVQKISSSEQGRYKCHLINIFSLFYTRKRITFYGQFNQLNYTRLVLSSFTELRTWKPQRHDRHSNPGSCDLKPSLSLSLQQDLSPTHNLLKQLEEVSQIAVTSISHPLDEHIFWNILHDKQEADEKVLDLTSL